jgi:phosphatidylglycerophosphatase A
MQQLSLADKVWRRADFFIAFGFGSGLMPFAPGTWGTLAALPLYLLMMHLSPAVYLGVTLLAFILGVKVCDSVSRDLGVHDYAGIVWDEVVGYLLTMFLVPIGISWMVVGFALFRLFDIWKPQPIRWVDQRVHGGLGIMLDDVLAALPACLILHFLVYLFK